VKKFKHRLIIDVTFDTEITETQAVQLMRQGLKASEINRGIKRFFIMDQPTLINFVLKQWGKVIAHAKKGTSE
jgi:hypothetical protein